MSSNILAVQHLRKMRGGSQSHLLQASDGACYVTKFQNNPQHVRVLANEMFATNLGRWLGLPMPRVEIIDVSNWLIEHSDDLRVEVARSVIPCSSGKQLASLYAGDKIDATIFDYLPEARRLRTLLISTIFRGYSFLISGPATAMDAKPFSSVKPREAKDTLQLLSTRDFVSMPANGPFPIRHCAGCMPGLEYMRVSPDGRLSSRHSPEPSRSIYRTSRDSRHKFRRNGTNTMSMV